MDAKFVQRLYEWLSKAGLNIFYDKTQLEAGAAFRTALQRSVVTSRHWPNSSAITAARSAVRLLRLVRLSI